MATAKCMKCGTLLAAEGVALPAPDAACPNCGHVGYNTIVMVGTAELRMTPSDVEVSVIEYSTVLLREADKLLTQGKQPGLSIVVAHTACEVATQRAFSRAFAHRGVTDIEDAVDELFSSYNLANQKVQQFYTALTGDQVQKEVWWRDFTQSSKRRNDIVHHGKRATDAEAAASLTTCAKLVEHITKYQLPPRP